MKHALIIICVTLLLSACAAAPTTTLEPQLESLSPGLARIYFLRDSSRSLNEKVVRINVNGKEVGSLASRSSFFIDRIPGNYHISVETFGTPAESVIDAQMEANKRYYVQVAAYEKQSRIPASGSSIAATVGGAVGGALGALFDLGGGWMFGVTPIDSSVGEALLRKFK